MLTSLQCVFEPETFFVDFSKTGLALTLFQTTAGINAGWRAWRLRVEDAGVWMIHCHILQHMAMGMQSVWVMGDYEQITRIPYPDTAGYLEYGGSAFGNASFSPSYVHQFDD
jgi:L-ascorbate oxidase